MRAAVVVVLMLLAATTANAQPGETPVIAPAAPPPQPVDRKDPSVAVLLSLGLPVAGIITLAAAADDNEGAAWLGFGGIYLGPSVGRWYAGEAGAGTLALRTLGGVSMVSGLVMVLGSEYDCDFDIDCTDSRERAQRRGRIGGVLMLGGAGLWVGTTIADIVYAKRAADSWNQRHAVAVGPTFTGANRAPGLVLSARF